MKHCNAKRNHTISIVYLAVLLLAPFLSFAQAPANDVCATAIVLTPGTTCVSPTNSRTGQTLDNATGTLLMPSCGAGNTASADVWYRFVATTAYPVITLSNVGTDFRSVTRGNGAVIQLMTASLPCLTFTSVACITNTTATVTLNTATSPGGAGLIVGDTYYIRICSNNNSGSTSGSAWGFDICITDPAPGRIEFSRSYINVTRGATGGTVSPGDTLEMRATLVLFSGTPNASLDSLSYLDTLFNGRGYALVPGTIALRTNEGLIYRSDPGPKVAYTDAFDADAGYYYRTGSDTIIRINFGAGASQTARGQLSNTSRPSVFGSTCIIMATYRVRVYAGFNTKMSFKTGAFSTRDRSTGVNTRLRFKSDSLIVYSSPGLCPNAVSASNAIGVESNGTFGAPVGAAPLARNRGTTAYTPTYIYNRFAAGTGPGDYYYGIANNTSSAFTTNTALLKPDGGGFRVFNLWDITGDHTGATNTTRGNPPCDTTKPISATNPCGYMLVINSAYRTDTAFHYTVNNLCPNTYYEISAWFKNVCSKCSADSLGNGSGSGSYQAGTPGDTSGVKPNIAFDVNGTDYYTTGNITYNGTLAGVGAQRASDTTNTWVKRGFTYLTGPTQTSFLLTLRNNAPGGGGNDWAMDDIAVATCLPNMKYSPSLTPTVCRLNPIRIYDTIRSYFNNYVYYKWQRSTDGGFNWTDVTAAQGPVTPTNYGTYYEYVTSYTVPVANTALSNNGDRYRVIVATTAANLGSANCIFTDGVSIITLNIMNCGIPLKTDLLSFTGKVAGEYGQLTWTTSKEDEPVHFEIERSIDGNNFTVIGTVNGYNNISAVINSYTLTDPLPLSGKKYYRIVMISRDNSKKYSRVIQLSKEAAALKLVNVINPFNENISFDITIPNDGKIEVLLMDMYGKIARRTAYVVSSGSNSLSLSNTSSLPAGMYVFQVNYGSEVITRKLVKKG